MTLIIQIKLILFSLLFGIFFGVMTDINHKYLYNKRKVLKVIFTFIYIVLSVLIYFLILKKINYGILHYYSFICIVIGFVVENFIVNKYIK